MSFGHLIEELGGKFLFFGGIVTFPNISDINTKVVSDLSNRFYVDSLDKGMGEGLDGVSI